MEFNLKKETQEVNFILEKKQISGIVATVGLNVDTSGSTKGLYDRGIMQKAVQYLMPITLNFDDNGELDVWSFNEGSSFYKLKMATAANLARYVQDEILYNNKIDKWGGTDYSEVIKANLTEYGFITTESPKKKGFLSSLLGSGKASETKTVFQSESKTGYPAIVYHMTDGECSCSDEMATRAVLKAAQVARCNIYFQFIGIGEDGNFSFLEKIADEFDNTGFLAIRNIEEAVRNSNSFYEGLLPEELCKWLRTKK